MSQGTTFNIVLGTPPPQKKVEFDHLIVTRGNLNWMGGGFTPTQARRRLQFMNRTLRPSIEQQTNKNFKFISLWNEKPTHNGIDGEIMEIMKSRFILNKTFTKTPVIHNPEVVEICKKHITKDYVLVTKVDNDDCLGMNFVDVLQKNLDLTKYPYYYDIKAWRTYNLDTKRMEMAKLPYTSMFLSVLEKSSDFVCYPYNYMHPQISEVLDGKHIRELDGLFTRHSDNSYAGFLGQETRFDLKNYSPKLT